MATGLSSLPPKVRELYRKMRQEVDGGTAPEWKRQKIEFLEGLLGCPEFHEAAKHSSRKGSSGEAYLGLANEVWTLWSDPDQWAIAGANERRQAMNSILNAGRVLVRLLRQFQADEKAIAIFDQAEFEEARDTILRLETAFHSEPIVFEHQARDSQTQAIAEKLEVASGRKSPMLSDLIERHLSGLEAPTGGPVQSRADNRAREFALCLGDYMESQCGQPLNREVGGITNYLFGFGGIDADKVKDWRKAWRGRSGAK